MGAAASQKAAAAVAAGEPIQHGRATRGGAADINFTNDTLYAAFSLKQMSEIRHRLLKYMPGEVASRQRQRTPVAPTNLTLPSSLLQETGDNFEKGLQQVLSSRSMKALKEVEGKEEDANSSDGSVGGEAHTVAAGEEEKEISGAIIETATVGAVEPPSRGSPDAQAAGGKEAGADEEGGKSEGEEEEGGKEAAGEEPSLAEAGKQLAHSIPPPLDAASTTLHDTGALPQEVVAQPAVVPSPRRHLVLAPPLTPRGTSDTPGSEGTPRGNSATLVEPHVYDSLSPGSPVHIVSQRSPARSPARSPDRSPGSQGSRGSRRSLKSPHIMPSRPSGSRGSLRSLSRPGSNRRRRTVTPRTFSRPGSRGLRSTRSFGSTFSSLDDRARVGSTKFGMMQRMGSRQLLQVSEQAVDMSPSPLLNRRQFFEVFSACSDTGQFITLLPEFDRFADEEGKVDGFEVMAMLILFCTGLDRNKVRALFKVFKPAKAEGLHKGDVACLVWGVLRGVHHLGIITERPTLEEATHIGLEAFLIADINMDGQVSGHELLEWGMAQMRTFDMLTQFRLAKPINVNEQDPSLTPAKSMRQAGHASLVAKRVLAQMRGEVSDKARIEERKRYELEEQMLKEAKQAIANKAAAQDFGNLSAMFHPSNRKGVFAPFVPIETSKEDDEMSDSEAEAARARVKKRRRSSDIGAAIAIAARKLQQGTEEGKTGQSAGGGGKDNPRRAGSSLQVDFAGSPRSRSGPSPAFDVGALPITAANSGATTPVIRSPLQLPKPPSQSGVRREMLKAQPSMIHIVSEADLPPSIAQLRFKVMSTRKLKTFDFAVEDDDDEQLNDIAQQAPEGKSEFMRQVNEMRNATSSKRRKAAGASVHDSMTPRNLLEVHKLLRATSLTELPAVEEEEKPELKRSLASEVLIHRADVAAAWFGVRVRLMMKRARKTKIRIMTNRSVIASLTKHTAFTKQELQKIAESFTDVSEAHGGMGFTAFSIMLTNHFSGLAESSNPLSVRPRRLFQVFDVDGDGYLNFYEFCNALHVIIRGTPEERLRALFMVQDVHNAGEISVMDIVRLLKDVEGDLKEVITFAEEVVRLLDVDDSGSVDVKEFLDALGKEPALLQTFQSCVQVTMQMVLAIRGLYQAQPKLNFETLSKLPHQYRTRKHDFMKSVNLQGFRDFMQEQFECGEDVYPQVDAVFHAFDLDAQGHLVLRNIMNGLGQMLSRTTYEQTKFLFELYDIDGNGSLDPNEIMYMLLSTQEMTDPTAAVIIEVMSLLDDDGNGRISCDELVARGMRIPLISRTLDKWFQVPRRVLVAPQDCLKTVAGLPISKLMDSLLEEDVDASDSDSDSLSDSSSAVGSETFHNSTTFHLPGSRSTGSLALEEALQKHLQTPGGSPTPPEPPEKKPQVAFTLPSTYVTPDSSPRSSAAPQRGGKSLKPKARLVTSVNKATGRRGEAKPKAAGASPREPKASPRSRTPHSGDAAADSDSDNSSVPEWAKGAPADDDDDSTVFQLREAARVSPRMKHLLRPPPLTLNQALRANHPPPGVAFGSGSVRTRSFVELPRIGDRRMLPTPKGVTAAGTSPRWPVDHAASSTSVRLKLHRGGGGVVGSPRAAPTAPESPAVPDFASIWLPEGSDKAQLLDSSGAAGTGSRSRFYSGVKRPARHQTDYRTRRVQARLDPVANFMKLMARGRAGQVPRREAGEMMPSNSTSALDELRMGRPVTMAGKSRLQPKPYRLEMLKGGFQSPLAAASTLPARPTQPPLRHRYAANQAGLGQAATMPARPSLPAPNQMRHSPRADRASLHAKVSRLLAPESDSLRGVGSSPLARRVSKPRRELPHTPVRSQLKRVMSKGAMHGTGFKKSSPSMLSNLRTVSGRKISVNDKMPQYRPAMKALAESRPASIVSDNVLEEHDEAMRAYWSNSSNVTDHTTKQRSEDLVAVLTSFM